MRTGLEAEVPSLELCQKMAAVPALAEAFKESALVWIRRRLSMHSLWSGWEVERRPSRRRFLLLQPNMQIVSAPTVREMLVLLNIHPTDNARLLAYTKNGEPWHELSFHTDISDPDALAKECLEAAKGQRP